MAPASAYCEPGYTHPSAVSVILVTIPEHTIQQKLKKCNCQDCEIHETLTFVA